MRARVVHNVGLNQARSLAATEDSGGSGGWGSLWGSYRCGAAGDGSAARGLGSASRRSVGSGGRSGAGFRAARRPIPGPPSGIMYSLVVFTFDSPTPEAS